MLLVVQLFAVTEGEIAQQTDKEQGEIEIKREVAHAVVLPIGVHATEEVVDPEEGHQNRVKSDHGKEVEQPKATPVLRHAEMSHHRIDNHR